MSAPATLGEPLRVTAAGNRFIIDAPWERAEALHSYLQQHGVGSVMCLDPTDRQARLELWPESDPQRAQELLTTWPG
jgi:hypothetical protein